MTTLTGHRNTWYSAGWARRDILAGLPRQSAGGERDVVCLTRADGRYLIFWFRPPRFPARGVRCAWPTLAGALAEVTAQPAFEALNIWDRIGRRYAWVAS